MAKLPDIEYGPVQSYAGTPLAEGEAIQRATGVLAEGLTRYGMELVKTRTARATADLATGLADLESSIASRRYVTTQQLRNELGADFEALPPNVKARLTRKGLDIATGETVDVDREDIPMWEVAGPIYDARAKRLLEAAGKNIDIPGWRSKFEMQATDEIVMRKLRVNDLQMRAMDTDLRAQQAQSVQDLARAGSFDQALAVVGGSDVFTPAEKEKLQGHVEHDRETQPFEDAVLRGIHTTADVLQAGKLVGRLESGEGLEHVEDRERIERKRELERLVAGWEREQKYGAEHAFDELDGLAQDVVVDALVKARGGRLPFSLVPPRGQASPKMREHLYRIIEGTQKGETVKTDPAVYDVLSRLARDNPRAFVDHDILQYLAAGRLSMEHFTRFSDLQRTIKMEGLGPKYSSFVGPQEETDRLLLDRGIQVRGEKIKDEDQKIRGYIHSVVDGELFRATARKGKQLEVDERNAIIRSIVAREFRAKPWRPWRPFGGGHEAPAAAVDPIAPGGAFQRMAIRLGIKTDEEPLAKLSADFEGAVPAIAAGWRRATPKNLRQEDALAIFELMRREQKRIDAALQAQGKAIDEMNRADVATQLFLGGMR